MTIYYKGKIIHLSLFVLSFVPIFGIFTNKYYPTENCQYFIGSFTLKVFDLAII